MVHNHTVSDGEPEASALSHGPRREEGLEDPTGSVRTHARSRVTHEDPDVPPRGEELVASVQRRLEFLKRDFHLNPSADVPMA